MGTVSCAFALTARDRATKLVVQTRPDTYDPAHNHWLRRRGHVKPRWAERIATAGPVATAAFGHAQSETNAYDVPVRVLGIFMGHE